MMILARLTAAETLRQPICAMLTMICVVITAAIPLLTAFNFGEPGRLARDSGLAFQLMFGLALAAYAACASIERERNDGTLATVLSKPVSRSTFFVAKYFGIASVITIFSVCIGFTTLLAQRIAMRYTLQAGYSIDHRTAWFVMLCPIIACLIGTWLNYRHKQSFSATVFIALPVLLLLATILCGCFDREGHWTAYQLGLQWHILLAALQVLFALLVLAALALSLSVRFSLTPTIAICFCLLLLGLASDYCFGGQTHRLTAILYLVIPNWQNFWAADALADGGSLSFVRIALTSLYALLYTAGILCLGGVAFEHTEVS